MNMLPVTDPHAIRSFEVRRRYDAPFVCERIEEAAGNGMWFVLLFHHVVDREPEEYQISTTLFPDIIKCIRALQSEGRADVRTIADMITRKGEGP